MPHSLRNSVRNLTLLSRPDISQALGELRREVESLRGELHALRGEIGPIRTSQANSDDRVNYLSARIEYAITRLRGLSGELRGDYYERQDRPSPTEYWTRHNVTSHYRFTSVEDSLQQFELRNRQYPGYIDLLPVTGKDGLAVLDFGCGPGHDLVGFAHYSRPHRLVGVDIATSSLAEAEQRLRLHRAEVELVQVDYGTYDLPFQSASFDYIHCSGVLMCVEDPPRLLREFARLLKAGGELRLMVYNYDSIWLHLYVAFVVQIENGLYSDLPTRVAFTRTTDGEDCPVNAVWRPEEMVALGRETGYDAEFLGSAMSLWELHLLPRRYLACLQPALPDESRAFLTGLRIDAEGFPRCPRHLAGIDGCYRFRRLS